MGDKKKLILSYESNSYLWVGLRWGDLLSMYKILLDGLLHLRECISQKSVSISGIGFISTLQMQIAVYHISSLISSLLMGTSEYVCLCVEVLCLSACNVHHSCNINISKFEMKFLQYNYLHQSLFKKCVQILLIILWWYYENFH